MNEGINETSSYEYRDENTAAFFDEIIIISDKEEYIPADISSIDATIIPFSAPENALYYILAQKENNISYSALILCEYAFGDFDAALLISLLRLHPLGALFPAGVIFSAPQNDADKEFIAKEKINLKALGASFFLVHPFSFQSLSVITRGLFAQNQIAFEKYYNNLLALEKAPEEKRRLFMANWEQKINAFEKSFVRFFYTPDENADYEEIFEIGQQKFNDRLFHQATTCFMRSSKEDSPHKSDSFAYLYIIEKEQGQAEQGKVYLERALNAFMENNEWEKAADCAKMFSEDFPAEQNPLFSALQKNFSRTNYGTVNKILETAEKIFPTKDIAAFMLQFNGSKDFPPAIAKYLSIHTELQKIIFSSNIKDLILDGDAYRKEQERQRALNYLEKQRLTRIHGENPAKTGKTQTSQTKREPIASLALDLNSQEDDSPADKETLPNKTNNDNAINFKEEETIKGNKEKQKEPQLHRVEDMPTVMLSGGSFLGDMINMAKYTRNFYKKK